MSARIVIIGGGILGCSIAYWLTRMGETDVLLLEQHQLTDGATWHAAGLVGQLRSSRNTTRMLEHSVEMYRGLEAETGQAVDWHETGSLRLACSPERMMELKRLATMAKSFGLPMEIVSPQRAQELFPLMSTEDVLAAAFLPTDGYIDPASVTQAIARGARMRGARIQEHTAVTSITVDGRRVTTVHTVDARTGAGEAIECEMVVNAAGMWGMEVGRMVGARVPAIAVEHQYMLSGPIEGYTPVELGRMPTMRDPDHLVYYKPDGPGLLVGGYEPDTVAFGQTGIPSPFQRKLFDPDFDRFAQLAEMAAKRTPVIEQAGIRSLINGAIPYSADADFVMGRAPELDNFYVATGFLYGIAAGGGAGKMMAEWMLEGRPSLDLWPLDVRRFSFHHTTRHFMGPRMVELYAHHYKLSAPGSEKLSARGIRRSPLHDTLASHRAVFGSRGGWERPNWFAPPGVEPVDEPSFAQPNWFAHVGAAHHAVRNGVGLIDQTSFAKFALKGPDAVAALDWICANDVHKPVGSLTYTQMLDDSGGIQCDLTVCRVANDEFYIVTGTGFATHDFDWIQRNIPAGANAQLFDITSAWSVLTLMGPNARTILQSVTRTDLGNETFRFGTMQTIGIAGCPVRALRVTYMGELGWELHLPVEYAGAVYDSVKVAGSAHGLVNAGYRAIESCRLEKGYRAWGSDIGPDHTPVEAGLGWAVKLKSGIEFKGRQAIESQRTNGVRKMLATFTVDPSIVLLGRETIYRDGQRVGWLTSAGFGYTVDRSIGLGYVRNREGVTGQWVLDGSYELEVATQRVPAEVSMRPLYDPTNARVKS